MKKITYTVAAAGLMAVPLLAGAQGFAGGEPGGPLADFVEALTVFIDTIAIPFLFALAFLVFIWGAIVFFIAGGSDDDKREKGKNLMIYAVIGFVMIIILFGLVNFISETLGLEGGELELPPTPGA